MVFLIPESESQFRIEIDPDEIPQQIRSQAIEMMNEFSKSQTCIGSQTTRANGVFQVDFLTRSKANKSFQKMIDLLQSSC